MSINSLILTTHQSFNLCLKIRQPTFSTSRHILLISTKFRSPHFFACSSSNNGSEPIVIQNDTFQFHTQVGTPKVSSFSSPVPKFSLSDQAFFLLAFIACTTSVAFTSLVFAAVPTLVAMRNAAISLSKLADTAREELPSTMAAVRLSGMEISDLTLELSDLSQEITEGINKSTQALQAAEAGIRNIGSMAQQQTMSMIQERASLPIISLQPAVAGAARKTSRAVGRATKSLIKIISGKGEVTAEYDEDDITYM
ncbi:uncharacterized protein LOC107477367 [Arachis duranensis]|uniref:Uncharacterized protein LOC107477367 n=1 Tax=Arachis duranensis TaxID=130453 RepID=A0A6P4CNJ1_ARADU|nr:uncharacterized protein LOC107477367 [Arachis duranensis]